MENSILFITDSFNSLKQEKDTSIFIMKEALRRDFEVFQCEMSDLTLKQKLSSKCSQIINNNDILETAKKNEFDLESFSFCFMRKDPPVDQDYMNCLHLLNIASQDGASIINNPNAIKIFNEKIFAMEFKDLMPPTIISADSTKIEEFLKMHEEIVIKPLNGMGGDNIYKISTNDQKSWEKY
jgi:Glutathione synthase/Ribosomal protein S6 modification enzyme (glutaminyl transferase)